MNLSAEIEARLPAEMLSIIQIVAKLAARRQHLYMVGGAVRDLLLNRNTLDLDLVVEGDAISLAKELVKGRQVKLTAHTRFNTAKLQWQEYSVDITTARSEKYARPGALPDVKPDSLNNDLFRRDFTINAMAVSLSPGHYGELIDLYGGIDDLNRKIIRILHQKSFVDDATRIWRAIRYEQRLGFSIEPDTMAWLQRDIRMLETVTGDRIRYELELVLSEELPEKALSRAFELGVLAKVHPFLRVDRRLKVDLKQVREHFSPEPPSMETGFALLVCHLSMNDVEEIISYLKVPGKIARVMRDTVDIINLESDLAERGLTHRRIYHLLHGFQPQALLAASIAAESAAVQSSIRLYLDKLRHVKTVLNGNDLLRLGVSEGPAIKDVLQQLLDARLDRRVEGRKGEEEMVRKMAGIK